MDFVFNVLVVLHFVGLASLLGGVIVQMKSPDKRVNPAMLHGALTQLVTGVALVGLVESGAMGDDETLNMTKISVKLVIVLVITALAIVGRRRVPPQMPLWATIGVLTLANVVIAVFW